MTRTADPAGWWDLMRGRLAPGATARLPMLTGSMAPTLPVGSTLIIIGSTGTPLSVGDVVVFRDGDRLVAHRLVAGAWLAGRGAFLQAGDTESRASWLPAGRVVGLAIGVTGTDGRDHDLRSAAARRDGRRRARQNLARCVLAPARRVKSWLK